MKYFIYPPYPSVYIGSVVVQSGSMRKQQNVNKTYYNKPVGLRHIVSYEPDNSRIDRNYPESAIEGFQVYQILFYMRGEDDRRWTFKTKEHREEVLQKLKMYCDTIDVS